jgi:N-ethylmaleimide reductase
MLETAEAMIAAWSAERIGVRLSPSSLLYGMHNSNDFETFGYVVRELDAMRPGPFSRPERSGHNQGCCNGKVTPL